jgi:hypothetical protein
MSTHTPEHDLRRITDPIERALRAATMLEDPRWDAGVLRRVQQEALVKARRPGWPDRTVAEAVGLTIEQLAHLRAGGALLSTS